MLKTQGLTPVTTEQGKGVAQKMGAGYMECSSKEMRGVDEIFERAILTVVSGDGRNAQAAPQRGGDRGADTRGMMVPGGGAPKRKKRRCNFL